MRKLHDSHIVILLILVLHQSIKKQKFYTKLTRTTETEEVVISPVHINVQWNLIWRGPNGLRLFRNY